MVSKLRIIWKQSVPNGSARLQGPSYAFIVFDNAESANQAISHGSMTVDGRLLKFEPRRLHQQSTSGSVGGNGRDEVTKGDEAEEDAESTALATAASNGASRARSLQVRRTSRQTLCTRTGACTINRPCAQQYVGKSQSCMVISGLLIVHAPVHLS